MNNLELNSLKMLMTEARIIDSQIAMAEKHEQKLRLLHEAAANELAFLVSEKKSLVEKAATLTKKNL
jgi:hypothetical protein